MKVLKFPSTAGFRDYEFCLDKISVSHPAKANLHLLEYLIENYTEEGSTVLDPMAGTFSTCIVAALLNRDGVGVELEEHFYRMGVANKILTDKHQTLTPKGTITVLRGDARELSSVLENVDQIITSPPYEAVTIQADKSPEFWEQMSKKHGRKYLSTRKLWAEASYSKKVDAIITSPPYEQTKKGDIDAEEWASKMEKFGSTPESRRNRHTLGRLRGAKSMSSGYDAVITSPPYSDTFNEKKHTLSGIAKRDKNYRKEVGGYSKREIDVVLTSPPYEASLVKHNENTEKEVAEKLGKAWMTKGRLEAQKRMQGGYAEAKAENIGNLKGDNYLTQMKIVYQNCFDVLKPEGRMILIVKNFIRQKKVVDLAGQTVKICEETGFKLQEHLLFKLPTKSFWRILYEKKNPSVDTSGIEHEHVLVFGKVDK